MFHRILLLIALLPCLVMAQTTTGKFGIVNTEALINLLPETAQVNQELKILSDRYESEIMKRTSEYQTKLSEFLTQKDSLPNIIQEAREQEIGRLQQQVQELRRLAIDDLQQQQKEKMSPIIDRVQRAIANVGDREGFVYVIDPQQGGLVYFSTTLCIDLMPMVKAELGLEAPATEE